MSKASNSPTAADFLNLKQRRRLAVCKAATKFLQQMTGDDSFEVHMRSLIGNEKNAFEERAIQSNNKVNMDMLKTQKAKLIQLCLCDEKGTPTFAESQVTDLLEMDAGFIDSTYNEISEHVGFQKGELERLVGNSEEIAAAVSS